MTFHELQKEWLEYKNTVTNSQNTIKRHEQHYQKYFKLPILHGSKVKKIDELMLETECNRIIREFNLPRKEQGNIKTILNAMFEYAVRKKYLSVNPMEMVQILVKFKHTVRKIGKTENYNSHELKELNRYLDHKYTETYNTVFLAVKLNFLFGLRVGELIALKREDYCDINNLHIVRVEVRYQITNQYDVVEHTKTNRDRFVVLIPKAINVLHKLEYQSEYIFMKNGERITSRQVAYVLLLKKDLSETSDF